MARANTSKRNMSLLRAAAGRLATLRAAALRRFWSPPLARRPAVAAGRGSNRHVSVRSRFFVPAPRAAVPRHAGRPLVVHAVAVRIGSSRDVVGRRRLGAEIGADAEPARQIAVQTGVDAMPDVVARRPPLARQIEAVGRQRERAVGFAHRLAEHIIDDSPRIGEADS